RQRLPTTTRLLCYGTTLKISQTLEYSGRIYFSSRYRDVFLECFSTRDVLCYVAVDAFGFHQPYSLWWKWIQLSCFLYEKMRAMEVWMRVMDVCYLWMASLLSIHTHLPRTKLHSLAITFS
ncbi:hypothetical protein SFRURICE_013300, partial [Spodoptera frugiperda]